MAWWNVYNSSLGRADGLVECLQQLIRSSRWLGGMSTTAHQVEPMAWWNVYNSSSKSWTDYDFQTPWTLNTSPRGPPFFAKTLRFGSLRLVTSTRHLETNTEKRDDSTQQSTIKRSYKQHFSLKLIVELTIWEGNFVTITLTQLGYYWYLRVITKK